MCEKNSKLDSVFNAPSFFSKLNNLIAFIDLTKLAIGLIFETWLNSNVSQLIIETFNDANIPDLLF